MYNSHVGVSVKSMRPWGVPFAVLAFRKVLVSVTLWPLCSLDVHYRRLLPNSQRPFRTGPKCLVPEDLV